MIDDNKTYVTDLINNQYVQLESHTSVEDKFNCINNIVGFKKLLDHHSQGSSLYLDYKKYLKYYIEAVETKDSGYDEISVVDLQNKLAHLDIELQINLNKFFKKTLLLNGYIDEAKQCDFSLQKLKLIYYKKNKSLLSYVKVIAIWSSISLRNLLIALILLFILASLFLIDSNIDKLAILDISTVHYSNNAVLNHLINTLTLFFNLEGGMKVVPNCVSGVLLVILAKLIFILILVNFMAKKIVEFIKIEN